MTTLIPNMAIAGYRSFGKDPQYFPVFSKVNFFIGKNNAGKSNVLRFLHDVYPKLATHREDVPLEALDAHQPINTPTLLGRGEMVTRGDHGIWKCRADHPLLSRITTANDREVATKLLGQLFSFKRDPDLGDDLAWIFCRLPKKTPTNADWKSAFQAFPDGGLQRLWEVLNGGHTRGGDRTLWEAQVLSFLAADWPNVKVAMIPAIRQIGKKGSIFNGFGGDGLIEKLGEYERPNAAQQADKELFRKITLFLQTVVDNPAAMLEVPHSRDTLHVDMDGKVLPLESLGSGVHEVIILAAAATVLQNQVVCIEEPELHLNPILQKKLVRYLREKTSNQYFITTHSAALMDTPGAEIYHITLVNGCSKVERVTSDRKKSAVCEDLGYHPSDLLQANCVIWVEGPSDRIYVAYWLKHVAPELIEGIHFSIMFYGGRLASHLSNEDIDGTLENFISLRRLNRRGVILIDSDKASKRAHVNSTKKRLVEEFSKGPGFAWLTAGREIENYLPSEQLKAALTLAHPGATPSSTFGQYDHCLSLRTKKSEDSKAVKVKVAHHLVEAFPQADLSILDLKEKVEGLARFIHESNPGFVATTQV